MGGRQGGGVPTGGGGDGRKGGVSVQVRACVIYIRISPKVFTMVTYHMNMVLYF